MAGARIEDRQSEERLISSFDEENFLKDSRSPSTRRPRRCRYHPNGTLILSSWTLFLFIASIYLWSTIARHRKTAAACQCDDYLPIDSPALEALENTGHIEKFDGSFAKPNAFKGPPSPAIDAAWDDITYASGGVINVDEQTLQHINASEYSVGLAEELGGGYMGSVEVLHQLHCLNMLRQASYEDYYRDKPGPWEDSPQILRHHLDHCIDILRQKLMCDADVGILTYVWVKGHKDPFPDFNVHHKCRDFRAVKQWVGQHQLYTTPEHGIERLPGAKEMPSPP
ncbi:oxidase ustYa family protein [Aspergillus tubingensis]|uniref:oxidase ustYa family protein n=1 Tax=Aspergillus tubingensis TaxID=5068 RepID=UPI0015793DAA|nr:Tat pathway signal sequence protein [Aspergillus tubingensis]GFN17143.1 Tat pathway signal sequence protein [Aspergillus tubingensis]GLB17675.1 hypothetical protein AtubIFM61612_007555 [Aspergillus tubingensis]